MILVPDSMLVTVTRSLPFCNHGVDIGLLAPWKWHYEVVYAQTTSFERFKLRTQEETSA